MQVTDKVYQAWLTFLDNEDNHAHANRFLQGIDIKNHITACWSSALATSERVKSDVEKLRPDIVLEVGSSTGLNCFALQHRYPQAEVIGIEPELEAVAVAKSMLEPNCDKKQPRFIKGYAENLPLEINSVDLIICHTVIEHVQDVPMAIKEMVRVLKNNGLIHLEAPNYIYPFEPHLHIVTIPKLGKWFVRWSALLQGKKQQINFLNHLQFVTPRYLEKLFKVNGLNWENRAVNKLMAATAGRADIKKYHWAASILKSLNKVGLAKTVLFFLQKIHFYPSALYTLNKKGNQNMKKTNNLVALKILLKKINNPFTIIENMIEQKSVLNVGAVGDIKNYLPNNVDLWLHDKITRKAKKVVGVDIDERGIEYAKEHGYEMRRANCETMNLNMKFDVIVMSDVIEHVNAPIVAIENLVNKHLVDNGILIITTPNATQGSICLRAFFRKKFNVLNDHVAVYYPEHFQAICGKLNDVCCIQEIYMFDHPDYRSLSIKVKSKLFNLLTFLSPRLASSMMVIIRKIG